MNTNGFLRFSIIVPGLGLATALLSGCPEKPACPNCEFRTATFTVTPGDVADMTSATMHTHVEIPSSECEGAECNVTRTDDFTCKLAGITTTQTKQQTLPVSSTASSVHTVTVQIQKKSGTPATLTGTVGEPSQTRPPTLPICR